VVVPVVWFQEWDLKVPVFTWAHLGSGRVCLFILTFWGDTGGKGQEKVGIHWGKGRMNEVGTLHESVISVVRCNVMVQ
jgi:hypothetical protein